MKEAVKQWLSSSRKKIKSTPLEGADLDQLENLLKEPTQVTLYLTARSTNMRSGIVAWALFDPSKAHEPELMSDDPPYKSVLDAVSHGWHVAQYPIINLYQYKDLDNDYVGFDFILEKWI